MTALEYSAPPCAVELRQWAVSDSAQLRPLRASLRQLLVEQDLGGPNDDDVVLVATELIGNALQHGSPPTTLRLLRTDTGLILDVADNDLAALPRISNASSTRARGRGLSLTQAMAHQLGWYATGTAKHVWASFSLD